MPDERLREHRLSFSLFLLRSAYTARRKGDMRWQETHNAAIRAIEIEQIEYPESYAGKCLDWAFIHNALASRQWTISED